MTDHVARLYALAVAVLVFLVAWAAVADRPWASASTATPDPRVQALIVKQQRVRTEALAVQRVLAARRQQAALASTTPPPAPSVRVVTLPPLTITRTS
jgi:hypothetical protein